MGRWASGHLASVARDRERLLHLQLLLFFSESHNVTAFPNAGAYAPPPKLVLYQSYGLSACRTEDPWNLSYKLDHISPDAWRPSDPDPAPAGTFPTYRLQPIVRSRTPSS
jgi:hypothetical protein